MDVRQAWNRRYAGVEEIFNKAGRSCEIEKIFYHPSEKPEQHIWVIETLLNYEGE